MKAQSSLAFATPEGIAATTAGSERHRITVFAKKAPPTPSKVFDTYWQFAVERQRIFFARVSGARGPWTEDPVLLEHKFTNAYRAADRTSQYLIHNVIYALDSDWPTSLLRILLFKIFNRQSTWELLEAKLGPITLKTFSPGKVNAILDHALARGERVYSNAYIMPSGPASIREPRKHRMHTALLNSIIQGSLAKDLIQAKSMERAFNTLRSVPGFGPFLALQFLIDLNYSAHINFSEMEFVVPGPGARDGIRKCFLSFGDYDEAGIIAWVTDRQQAEFETRGLNFQSLWGRPLQLIDCQNLFCEVDKYARVIHPDVQGHSGRTRIKQRFTPDLRPIKPWFPPKWGLNERIVAG